jgi:hypothetical protein
LKAFYVMPYFVGSWQWINLAAPMGTDMPNIENRLHGGDGKQPKEVSGVWVLLILGGLILLVLLSHWLRQ